MQSEGVSRRHAALRSAATLLLPPEKRPRCVGAKRPETHRKEAQAYPPFTRPLKQKPEANPPFSGPQKQKPEANPPFSRLLKQKPEANPPFSRPLK